MNPPDPAAPHVESDTRMTRTYVQVLVLEAAIIVGLWVFGRRFS